MVIHSYALYPHMSVRDNLTFAAFDRISKAGFVDGGRERKLIDEMVALLAEAPQARRMLRPLCRALALELPWVRATPGEAVAESGERPPRNRRPRVQPEPFRTPLPRGVRTAARRQGFGKMC